jgi:aminoglycoside phosphotransferase (APT) family kinase protein
VVVVARMHDDEIDVDEDLVRSLLDTLSPSYDGLPLRRLDRTGSTNALFRLGDHLLVRVPRQPDRSGTIDKEARWMPHLARALSVPVPEVVALGEPAAGYPERWSIVRWLDGEVPVHPRPGEAPRHDLARDLAAVVTALRDLPVPAEARSDPALHWYRCDPLEDMDQDLRRLLRECREVPGLDVDLQACATVWDDALAAGPVPTEPRWLHADLLGENLLVRDGRLAAVLDFGGLGVGDPTVDLVVAWDLLDDGARRTFRGLVDVDDATWLRGRAWAMALSVMAFPYYWRSMPDRCASRLEMVGAVLEGVSR